MSTTVDSKVVEMRFDNKNFEANVATTMSTLDKFKQMLHFDGATKGLEKIGAAAGKCDLSPIGRAAETVHSKFSALEVMAVTALANITNSALNTGKQMLKSLTIEPITTGFNEYEQKMGSVQTIMASTGESLETVNGYLEELNAYSDKTIYSFSDMTQNIGKFTNAGVKLEDAVAAIKGISNEAAVSGANANEASRAMYNFAQALSAGHVKLIDWKSIENANMATVEFKNALLDTAVECGVLGKTANGMYNTISNGKVATKDAFDATRNFNDSLKDEWMTTEVLTKTLKKYADENSELGKKAYAAAQDVKTFSMMMDTLKEAAQSGWAQTWEIIVGDFEEAKELFTAASNFLGGILEKSAKARNDLLKGALGAGDGWEKFEEKLKGAGIASDDFQEKLKETARAHNINIDEMIEKEGSFVNTLKNGWLTSDLISETLGKYTDDMSKVSGATSDMTDKLEYFQKVVDDVWRGDYGNVDTGRIEKLKEAGYDYAEVQALVNKTVDGHRLTLEDLTDEQKKAVGYTDEQIAAYNKLAAEARDAGTPLNELIESMSRPTGRQLLIESLANAGKGLVKIFNAIKYGWNDAFPPATSDQLYNIIKAVHDFSENLDFNAQTVARLSRIFRGLFAALDIVTTIASGGIKIAFKILCKIFNVAGDDVFELVAKVADAITAFRDWLFEGNALVKFFEKFIEIVVKVIKVVKGWIEEFMALPEVQAKITAFKDACSDVFSGIKDYFSEGGKRISEFINRVNSMDKISLADAGKIFKDFKENVIDYFFDIDGAVERIKEVFSKFKDHLKNSFSGAKDSVGDFKDGLKSGFDKVVDVLKNFKNKIGAVLTNIKDFISDHMGAIVTIGIGVGLIAIGKGIKNVLEIIVNPLETLGDFLNSIGKSFNKIAKGIAFQKYATGILILAGAITLLVFALRKITEIPKDQLWSSMGVLGALAGGIIAFALAISLMNKFGGQVSIASGSLVAIAAAMVILVQALKGLDEINSDHIGRNIAILGAMAIGLGVISGVLARFAPSLSTGSLTLLAVAASMKLLVGVMEDVAKLDPVNANKSLQTMLGVVIAAAILMAACKGVKWDAIVPLLGVVGSLYLLMLSFKLIAKMDLSEVKNNLGAFIAVFGIFTLLMLASRKAGQHSAKAGAAILMMSGALIIIAQAIKSMAKIGPNDLDRAITAILKIMVVFSLVIAVSKLAEHGVKAGALLLSMSVALLILSGVIWMLSEIDDVAGLKRATGVITLLGGVFAVLIAITGKYGKSLEKAKGTIIAFTVAIGLMALAVALLSLIKPEKLAVATTALSALMVCLSIMVKATGKAKKAALTLGILTGVVGALAFILASLSGVDPKTAMGNAVALSTLMLALSASLKIISKVESVSLKAIGALAIMASILTILAGVLWLLDTLDATASLGNVILISALMAALSGCLLIVGNTQNVSLKAVGALAIMAVIMGAMGGVLWLMRDLDPESAMSNTLALSTLIGAISGCLKLISTIQKISIPAIAGIVGMGILLFGLGVVLVQLQQMGLDIGIEQAVSLSILLIALATAAKITSLLPDAATMGSASLGLAAFLGVLAGIGLVLGKLNEFYGIGDAISNGMDILADIGLGIGDFVGSLISGIGEGLLAGLPGIGEHLSAFMDKAGGFIAGLESIKPEHAEAAKNLALAMLAFTAADLIDGILGLFGAGVDFGTFGEQIAGLGSGLKSFATEVEGIDAESVNNAATAAGYLGDLAANMQRYGGLIGDILGDKMDLGTFGEDLKPLGEGLKAFSDAVAGIEADNIQNAATGAGYLADLASNMQRYEGAVGAIFGDKMELDEFGDTLEPLGKGLKQFSDAVVGIDNKAVEDSGNAAMVLATLASKLPSYGGAIEDWFGEKLDLTEFGTQMVNFAWKLVSYSNIVSGKDGNGVDANAVTASGNAAMILSKLANSLPSYGGALGAWFGDQIDLASFGMQLDVFGKCLVGYSWIITQNGGINSEAIQASADAATILVNLANTLPATDGKVGDWFGGTMSMGDFGMQLTAFGKGLASYSESVSGIDTNIVTNTAKAAESLVKLSDTLPDNKLFVNETTIDEFGKQLAKFGEKMLEYYNDISGIGVYQLSSVITQTGRLVDLASGMATLDSSGMKDFGANLTKLGDSGVEGFVGAFENSADRVTTAAGNMVKNLVNGVGANKYQIETIASEMTQVIIDKLEFTYPDFTKGGEQIVSRFCTGVNNGKLKLMDAVSKIVSDILGKITARYREFNKAGEELMNLLNAGLSYKSEDAKKTMSSILDNVITAATGYSDTFTSIGEDLVAGFVLGINNKKSEATEAARQMALAASTAAKEALDVNSPSKVFKEIGSSIPEGTALGIKNNVGCVEDATEDMANSTLDTFKDTLEIHSPPKTFIEVSKYLPEGVAKGIESNLSSATDAAKDMGKSVLSAFKTSIADQKFFGNLSVTEELESWKAMQGMYAEGSEERKEIDKQIFTLKQNVFDEEINNIETLTKEKKQSLYDELSAYKRLQSKYKRGTEQRIKLDEKIVETQKEISDANETYYKDVEQHHKDTAEKRIELEKEYYEETQKINDKLKDDIQSVNDSYEDAVKSRTDSLYGAYGLFDEVKMDKAVDGSQLIENLEDQVDAFNSWASNINSLANRGVSSELLDELRNMGPSAAANIAALTNMSDSELGYFVDLWRQKYEAARSQAVYELQDLRAESNAEIIKLKQEAQIELAEYTTEWTTKMTELNTESEAKLTELRNTWKDNIGLLREETESEFTKMTDNIAKIIGDKHKWSEQGANVIEGYMEGIVSKSGDLDAAVVGVMNEVTNASEEALDINSPSKVFEGLGEYTAQGFILGLQNLAGAVSSEAGLVGEGAIDGMFGAMSHMTDISGSTELSSIGSALISKLNNGLDYKSYTVEKTTSTIFDKLVTSLNDYRKSFKSVGENLVLGFASGVSSKRDAAIEAAKKMAISAVAAAQEALGINSPSKVFYGIGSFATEGFLNAVYDGQSAVDGAVNDMAMNAVKAMATTIAKISDAVDSDIDIQPTITPVLDLSNIQEGAGRINSLFSHRQAVSANARMVDSEIRKNSATINPTANANGNTYNFNQYNTSPKALSTAEIYRQTNNQFSMMKRKVEST